MSQTKKLFLGFNWKMNPTTTTEAINLFQKYIDLKDKANFDFVIFAPSIYLNTLTNQGVQIGSQDISTAQNGAYTAQISGQMSANIGCSYAMIGHSEARRDYNLDLLTIKNKILSAGQNNLIPVYCIGFTDEKLAHTQLANELETIFDNISEGYDPAIFDQIQNNTKNQQTIIAFEPIASIGSGKALDPQKVNHYLSFIKHILTDKNLSNIKVLYGGSVTSTNIKELSECENLDGFLLGGASLKPAELEKIFEIL